MIAILSPAKNLDFETQVPSLSATTPAFINEANQLADILKKLNTNELSKLLKINQKLTLLNASRFMRWQNDPPRESTMQSIFAYSGEVYNGLKAKTLSEVDLNFAQNHLLILSGLYGVLKPFDRIQPYRLEMQTCIEPYGFKNLYEFWTEKITSKISQMLNEQENKIIINLASKEYLNAIQLSRLDAMTITPVFKDFKNGKYKFTTIYGKKARGMMARFFIKNRISNVEDLKLFDEDGYFFNEKLSNHNEWVFTRG